MKKCVYALFEENITQNDIDQVYFYLSKDELINMKRKMNQIFGRSIWKDRKLLAFAEKVFVEGYLAAHTHYPSEMVDDANS